MPFFKEIDLDKNGRLEIGELSSLLGHFIARYEDCHDLKLSEDDKKEMEQKLFDEMDED